MGSADLLAQMSDRCYLEKCRDRLFTEFHIANQAAPDMPTQSFASPEDMIYKTPDFFTYVLQYRLEQVLGGVYRYSERFFLPERDLYLTFIEGNYSYLRQVVAEQDISLLRRDPPWTLKVDMGQAIPVELSVWD